jgi:hypothetical protein
VDLCLHAMENDSCCTQKVSLHLQSKKLRGRKHGRRQVSTQTRNIAPRYGPSNLDAGHLTRMFSGIFQGKPMNRSMSPRYPMLDRYLILPIGRSGRICPIPFSFSSALPNSTQEDGRVRQRPHPDCHHWQGPGREAISPGCEGTGRCGDAGRASAVGSRRGCAQVP